MPPPQEIHTGQEGGCTQAEGDDDALDDVARGVSELVDVGAEREHRHHGIDDVCSPDHDADEWARRHAHRPINASAHPVPLPTPDRAARLDCLGTIARSADDSSLKVHDALGGRIGLRRWLLVHHDQLPSGRSRSATGPKDRPTPLPLATSMRRSPAAQLNMKPLWSLLVRILASVTER